MNFYYIVIETLYGTKQEPVMLNDRELKAKIEGLANQFNDAQHTIITEKAGWYRVNYGQRTSYLRYKRHR